MCTRTNRPRTSSWGNHHFLELAVCDFARVHNHHSNFPLRPGNTLRLAKTHGAKEKPLSGESLRTKDRSYRKANKNVWDQGKNIFSPRNKVCTTVRWTRHTCSASPAAACQTRCRFYQLFCWRAAASESDQRS